MDRVFLQSVGTFILRRGLTILGGGAAELDENQISQFIGVALVIGNEAVQFWWAHRHAKAQAATVKVTP